MNGPILKLTIKRKLMGMVDSQSCSSGNQTILDGTGDEKEGEVMSFGVRRLGADVIWWLAIGLILIAGQVKTLLS